MISPCDPEFAEPVTLASEGGVLEVTLTPRQSTAPLDTVATPVKNMLLFDYSVQRGTASNGQMSGGHQYPAPTLQVEPGERLIIHINNELRSLTIPDFYDPKYMPKGQTVPLYPTMMTSAPFNLHVHGAHVSPRGNADNVLLHIDAGMSNTYVYDIPKNMTPGTYWYHSHLHTLTASQTYYGLAGMLLVGRADSEIPLVTKNKIPIRTMLLQYNMVFDRMGGLAQMTNPNWPQWVSTLTPPKGNELANGTYRPSLAPVNFLESKKGTQWATVWYAGPLSINNMRGRFQFVPTNLQRFTADAGSGGAEYERGSDASRLQARRAVYSQRDVRAGPAGQAWANRDLGARQRQRHCVHERRAHRNRDRLPSEDRRRRTRRHRLRRSALSARTGRNAVADTAGDALCDRRDDAGQGIVAPFTAGPGVGRQDAVRTRRRSTPTTARRIRRRVWELSAYCRRRSVMPTDSSSSRRKRCSMPIRMTDKALLRRLTLGRNSTRQRPSTICRNSNPT